MTFRHFCQLRESFLTATVMTCYSLTSLCFGLLPNRALCFRTTVAGQAETFPITATMKQCSKCKSVKSESEFFRDSTAGDGLQSHCKQCRKSNRKAYSYPESDKTRRNKYAKSNQIKIQAQDKLNKAVKQGKIIRPSSCSKCGIDCCPDGHHFDYGKPLDVIWLCKPCHKQTHKQQFTRS
jgi:hypothetical protein